MVKRCGMERFVGKMDVSLTFRFAEPWETRETHGNPLENYQPQKGGPDIHNGKPWKTIATMGKRSRLERFVTQMMCL